MDFESKYFNFEENTFYFLNNQFRFLECVLDCDLKGTFYYKLLVNLRAVVLDIPNEHSMVLVNPDETTYFNTKIPAFDIKYIEDCFTLQYFPDPTNYLIKNSCPIKYTKQNIFDCWFHKNKSWSDLLSAQNQIKHYRFKDRSIIYNKQMLKKLAMSFTHKEDTQILRFIVDHNQAFNVHGRSLWKMMEFANVCEFRSWQSMRERYFRYIKADLTLDLDKIKSGLVFDCLNYPFLSRDSLIQLQRGLQIYVPLDPIVIDNVLTVVQNIKYFSL